MFFPVSLLPLHWRKDSVKSVFMHKETSTQDESSRDATAMEIETILRGVKCGAYLAPSTIENAGTYSSETSVCYGWQQNCTNIILYPSKDLEHTLP